MAEDRIRLHSCQPRSETLISAETHIRWGQNLLSNHIYPWTQPAFVSTIQADDGGGVIIWGMLFLGQLIPVDHRWNVTVYLRICF